MLAVTRRLACALWLILHRSDVADSHAVPSHNVPTITPTLIPDRPKLLPLIVTLTDPLTPRFRRRSTLVRPAHTENARVMLPSCSPTLIVARAELIPPLPLRQTMEVSDCHIDISLPLPPIRSARLVAATPRPDPRIVTLLDPVAATLDRNIRLTLATSCDIAFEALPTPLPTVVQTRNEPRTPCGA